MRLSVMQVTYSLVFPLKNCTHAASFHLQRSMMPGFCLSPRRLCLLPCWGGPELTKTFVGSISLMTALKMTTGLSAQRWPFSPSSSDLRELKLEEDRRIAWTSTWLARREMVRLIPLLFTYFLFLLHIYPPLIFPLALHIVWHILFALLSRF